MIKSAIDTAQAQDVANPGTISRLQFLFICFHVAFAIAFGIMAYNFHQMDAGYMPIISAIAMGGPLLGLKDVYHDIFG